MKTIFVSSTFRDMQFERDLIHNKITPLLNEKARDYGESVSFCDLRWGVSTENLSEEESYHKVLSVCLGEIERCRPYFVVILGDRYGFIPNLTMIDDVAQQKNFKLDSENCSITALEIEFGALCNSDQMKRTLFYFREIIGDNIPDIYKAEDSQHAEKLQQLKQKIRTYGGQIKNYTVRWNNEQKNFEGLENFSDMLVSDIFALMSEEFQEYAQLSEYEKDQRVQWEFAKQKSAQFAGRQHLVKNYVEILNSGVNFLVIKGESGSGKSTLMSQLAFNLRDEGYEVLPLFSSLTLMTSTASNVTRYIVEELERKIPETVSNYNEKIDTIQTNIEIQEKAKNFWGNHQWIFKICRPLVMGIYKVFKFLYSLIKKFKFINRQVEEVQNELQQQNNLAKFAFQKNMLSNLNPSVSIIERLESGVEIWNSATNKKFIILLDATDQLIDHSECTELISCFSKFKDNIQVVISCLPNFEFPENQAIKIETVEPLAPITKIEIINGILKFMGRELSDSVIIEILKKVNSENPLYLSLLINRLTMMDKKDFDAINADGGAIPAINSQQIKILQTCSDNLDDLCVDIINTASEKIGGEFVNLAMRYISISRYGLRESDLEKILTAKGVQWNSVDFALFVQYLSSFFVHRADGRIDFTHKNIRAGCLKLIDDKKAAHTDIVAHLKTLDAKDELKQNEIVWHCFKANAKDTFLNYIGEIFKMDEYGRLENNYTSSYILCQECKKIFYPNKINWWRDVLEYGKLQQFISIRPILSQFFGQIFFETMYVTYLEENILFNNYNQYIRLNFREYPDLLIAVYCIMGNYYKDKNKDKKMVCKFANKGIAIVKKIYSRQEIEKFTTCVLEDMIVIEGEMSPRADVFSLKEGIPIIVETDPNNPNRTIIKLKINW